MKLKVNHFGEQRGIPLFILHGLFGSARNWRAIANNFSRRRWVVTVDLRNHGQSSWNDDNSYEAMAADLAETISSIAPSADVLGHSMGGKAAMILALDHRELVNRLIVADIAPVKYSHSQSKNIALMKSLDLSALTRRSEAQTQLKSLTQNDGLAAFFAQNIIFGEGEPRWQLNLDALDQNMDEIIGFPDITQVFTGSTFVIYGGASDYVDQAGFAKFDHHFPNNTAKSIDGAGHWLHAENPREFLRLVDDFLETRE